MLFRNAIPHSIVAYAAIVVCGCDAVSNSNQPERDAFGFTELHRAARAEDMERVGELLLYGADPNARDEGGVAPIHRAARDGKYDLVTELVRYSADLDIKTNTGWTPLHLALRSGDLEMVDLLLDFGASPHVKLPDGMTPFIYAVSRDRGDIANTFLLRAETPDASGKTLDVNAKDATGNTALHYAVRNENTDVAVALLAAGADSELKNQSSESSFYLAVRNEQETAVSLMLQNGASVTSRTPGGARLIDYAQSKSPESMFELMLRYLPEGERAPAL